MFPKRLKEPPTPKTKHTRLRHLGVSGGTDLMQFAPEDIVIEPGHNLRNFNTPEMRAHLDELKTSIAASGVRIPLCIRWDKPNDRAILVDGETRLRACLELQAEGTPIKSVPCIQVAKSQSDNIEKKTLYLLQVNSGLPLTPLECGKGYARLRELFWTESKIALQVGRTIRYVKEALQIFDASPKIQAMVQDGLVTLDRAIAEVREHGEEAVSILTEEAVKAKADGRSPLTRKKAQSIGPYRRLVGKIWAEVAPRFRKDSGAKYFRVSANLIRELVTLTEAAKPVIP